MSCINSINCKITFKFKSKYGHYIDNLHLQGDEHNDSINDVGTTGNI